jgi:hypothetical protein
VLFYLQHPGSTFVLFSPARFCWPFLGCLDVFFITAHHLPLLHLRLALASFGCVGFLTLISPWFCCGFHPEGAGNRFPIRAAASASSSSITPLASHRLRRCVLWQLVE